MTLRETLAQKPFTLALSSGFFGFFAHRGMYLALEEAGLRPARVTGSSAGAIIAAAISHGLTARELEAVLRELRRENFWDPAFGFGFLKGDRLEALLREILQHKSPQIPLGVSTFNIFKRKTEAFSEGDIPRIVRASCAVPLMFHPVRIDKHFYWDGGIYDKAAIVSAQENENVLAHFLPSRGMHKLNERALLTALQARYKVISPRGLPEVGPYKLKDGLLATERAYEFASRALASDWA
jgi:NTE family protein